MQIGPHPHAAQSIHAREQDLRQLEALLRQRQQMRALLDHRRPHYLAAPGYPTLLVFAASRQQLCVQLREIPRLRHRHPVVAAKVASLTFDAAFG
jgi:hypothetical protein